MDTEILRAVRIRGVRDGASLWMDRCECEIWMGCERLTDNLECVLGCAQRRDSRTVHLSTGALEWALGRGSGNRKMGSSELGAAAFCGGFPTGRDVAHRASEIRIAQ